jgi:hypothetical protein
MIEKVVIFDWSGTLSPDAVRFAEDENLKRELERSGLAALGVATPETFWREIVNPTWEKGSTTTAGYAEMIARRIRAVFSPAVPDDRLRASAARFVDSYLTHSAIDGRWHPVLQQLNEDSSVVTIIATDHYAEVTGYLIRFLGEMDIPAVPLKDASGAPSPFIVANSADLGAHKADRAFWETIRSSLGLEAIRRVVVVDDFGFNEEAGDSYGERRKVETRKEATIALLGGVFSVPVSPVSFMWERGGNPEKDENTCGDLIARASGEIERYLSEG